MIQEHIVRMARDDITPIETEVVCSDFDKDCEGVKNKVNCWLYQPECGLCPFLNRARSQT
jgi:hypothetical protein